MKLEEMTFVIKPHMKASAAMNLAVEEALYKLAEKQLADSGNFDPVVRLYSFDKPSVVLGYGQSISDIDPDYCNRMGIDITMRTTGGGSVLLGEKDLQYSGIFPMSLNGRLPLDEAKQILWKVNAGMAEALCDRGFAASIEEENSNKVIRIGQKSFAFDAIRNSKPYGNGKYALLHHGTILVDNDDYFGDLPGALKASDRILLEMEKGALWINQAMGIGRQDLIRSLQKKLPFGAKIVVKDYTSEELALAKKLHDEFYIKSDGFPNVKSKGICYRPTFGGGPSYDLNKYVVNDFKNG